MTTDESIMAEMLDRATNPAKDVVDELGVQMFCIVVRSNAQLVHRAQEMIIGKIQTTNIIQATRAIALLEECMTQCGTEFQDEASKFRFLNELIRLVSKKYQGKETPFPIKQRIMECLLLWTTEFPQKQKIREAYDMLRKEGNIEHGQSTLAKAKRESVLDALDEEIFAKLIKSNDPENFKRANLLLQYRMNQEARRNELLLQHKCVVQEVQNTIQLLNQMIDTYDSNDTDGNETIFELYKSCNKYKPIFQLLPDLLDHTDAELIADTLEANTSLLAVLTRYDSVVARPIEERDDKLKTILPSDVGAGDGIKMTISSTVPTSTTESATTTSSATNSNFFKELLDDLLINDSTNTTPIESIDNKLSSDALAELSDIFGTKKTETVATETTTTAAAIKSVILNPTITITTTTTSQQDLKAKSPVHPQPQPYPTDLFKPTEMLEPEYMGTPAEKQVDVTAQTTNKATNKMHEIDALSDELFQKILPTQERICSFKRDSDKITLNDLARERMQAKIPTATAVPEAEVTPKLKLQSEINLDVEEVATDEASNKNTATRSATPIKHLSEIVLELDNITPTDEQRIILDDDEMQLSLNFTEERPSKNICVIVVSAQNKSKFHVNDFQFEASVKKPCKVRLLPATDSKMPPHKPFRPAAPINQIMLLLNTTGNPVDITCIVGYKLGNDPDPIRESLVAKDIPFVE